MKISTMKIPTKGWNEKSGKDSDAECDVKCDEKPDEKSDKNFDEGSDEKSCDTSDKKFDEGATKSSTRSPTTSSDEPLNFLKKLRQGVIVVQINIVMNRLLPCNCNLLDHEKLVQFFISGGSTDERREKMKMYELFKNIDSGNDILPNNYRKTPNNSGKNWFV